MKKYLLQLVLALGIFATATYNSQAQSIELVAGNTLNGAMNGVLLGGATMALQNSDDFEPVRVGVGAGTLYGIGVGVYDITQVETGQQFYKSGTFNDGTNSSIIVLLDTIYGAAGGAIIASSVSLILKKPLVDALQYGSGAGAWVGFGFGLIDSFMLAKGPNYTQQAVAAPQEDVGGLLSYSNASKSVEVGLLNPGFVKHKKLTQHTIKTAYSPTVEVLQLQLDF